MWPNADGSMLPLSEKFKDSKKEDQIEQSLRLIHTCNRNASGKLLTMYEVDSDGLLSQDEDLSNVILQAIVRLWVTGPSTHKSQHRDNRPGMSRLSSSENEISPTPRRQGDAPAPQPATYNTVGHMRRRDRRRNRAIQLAVQWDRPQVCTAPPYARSPTCCVMLTIDSMMP
jgi:hypothetical protein